MKIEDDLSCLCGKRFLRSSAALTHRRTCTKTKSHVSSLLENAKKVWEARKSKRAKVGEVEQGVLIEPIHATDASEPNSSLPANPNSDLTIAQRRTPRRKTAPKRLNDYVPHSPTPSLSGKNMVHMDSGEDSGILQDMDVVLEAHSAAIDQSGSGSESFPQADIEMLPPETLKERDRLCTLLNVFRLYRRYLNTPSGTCDPDPGEQGFPDLTDFYMKSGLPGNPSAPEGHLELEPNKRTAQPTDENRLIGPELDTCSNALVSISQPESLNDESSSKGGSPCHTTLGPYPNISSFLLGEWFWNGGSQKSQKDFGNLMRILRSQEFNIEDVQRTNWNAINKELGSLDSKTPQTTSRSNNASDVSVTKSSGWIHQEIRIQVPFHLHQLPKDVEPGPKPYLVGEFCYRKITSIIQETLSGSTGKGFHFDPHEVFWSPRENEPPQRVYGELYSSPAFIEAHKELQQLPRENGCSLPRVVVGLMFASDETHLAQFGDTTLWPLYMCFGNYSKYRRCRPNEHLYHHVAYFAKLPEAFKEFVSSYVGKKTVNPNLVTHCVREVLHAQWAIILDDEFLEAYHHGIVICCFDNILRRFFPRIFTYSADYKEKVAVSGIRSLPAKCPCPRCFTPLRDFGNVGTPEDLASRENLRKVDDEYLKLTTSARDNLYKECYAVDGDHVDGVLKNVSLAPIQNAFVSRLSGPRYGPDVFRMLVVDLMHEIEGGNWRALFIHLLRIVHCLEDKSIIHQINSRYRQIPTFGGDTIRRFQRNVTEMKSFAARDWEDTLQCAIPVFDGLLPEPHNSNIIKLLFHLAHWHGLAKLRVHTDASLNLLDELTTVLGQSFRHFKSQTCAAFKTQELPKEADARSRRNKKAASKASKPNQVGARSKETSNSLESSSCDVQEVESTQASSSEQESRHSSNASKSCPDRDGKGSGGTSELKQASKSKPEPVFKEFNLETYKFHAFGDYVSTIRTFGTTDSYSTEPGELEHRSSKDRYKRTSKKGFTTQMAQIERRQSRIRDIRTEINNSCASVQAAKSKQASDLTEQDAESCTRMEDSEDFKSQQHGDKGYFIAKSENDPGFLVKLRSHLLPRAKQLLCLTEEDQDIQIDFQHDRMFRHKTLRVSYTTYDMRTDEDVINPDTSHRDVILLKKELGGDEQKDHPFRYARVIGVYHVNVVCVGLKGNNKPERIDFLWVRWYEYQPPSEAALLDGLRFPDMNSESAFGFVDPGDVLRGCHIIPSFRQGKRGASSLEDTSEAFWYPKQKVRLITHPIAPKGNSKGALSKLADDGDDWNLYHVNPFVDRDMLMRYHWGMAIGHAYCLDQPSLSYTLGRDRVFTRESTTSAGHESSKGEKCDCDKIIEDLPEPLSAHAEIDNSIEQEVNEADPVVREGHYDIFDPESDELRDYGSEFECDSRNPDDARPTWRDQEDCGESDDGEYVSD